MTDTTIRKREGKEQLVEFQNEVLHQADDYVDWEGHVAS